MMNEWATYHSFSSSPILAQHFLILLCPFVHLSYNRKLFMALCKMPSTKLHPSDITVTICCLQENCNKTICSTRNNIGFSLSASSCKPHTIKTQMNVNTKNLMKYFRKSVCSLRLLKISCKCCNNSDCLCLQE